METRKVEENADEGPMSDENEEAEKVAAGMETVDPNVACALGEITEAAESSKVEEETNVTDVAVETRKVEEVTNVADAAVESRKVEEVTNVDDIAVETRKVEEEADEAAMSYDNEEEEKIVVGTEMADSNVACSLGETTEAVETRKVEEEADEAAMEDENEEAENNVMGTEMADAYVACTLGETTEADGVGMGDEIRQAEDKEEVAEVMNMAGMVEGTTDTEEDPDGTGAGMEEEAVEAEEMEVANEADLMEEEVDVADMTEYTEAEVAEEQSRSVSGGKRKRGRNSKSTGRVPVRKKVEEDVCFICFDGGELVLCDRR